MTTTTTPAHAATTAPAPLEFRTALIDGLNEHLPDRWRIIGSIRQVDTLSTPIAQIKPAAFIPTPAAPLGARDFDATVTIVSHHTDLERATSDLETRLLPEMLAALAALPFVRVTRGEFVAYDDTYVAWDITCTITETHHAKTE